MSLSYGSMKLCIILTVVLCGNSHTATTLPGFRTALTTKGLDYVCQVAVPILEEKLSSLSIPDISGSADSPIGTIDYTLSKIELSDLQIPTSSLTSSSEGLEVQASDLSLHVHADWQYREHSWPHIEDHGNCDVDASKISLQVRMKVAADSKGHGTLSSTYCHLYIDKLDIDFHGGASWLYNLFSSYIVDDLKGSIEKQVCSVATNEINTEGNKALESIPVIVKVDSTSEVDFALIQDPIFTTTYVETQHKGEFYDIAHPEEAPFTPPSLPAITENSRMLYMWLTDYMANSAGFVYQTAGVLHYNITPSMVPPSVPFQLNTLSFKDIIPQLYNKFPNWSMELELEATKPPLLSLSSSGGNFTVFGNVLVYVMNSTNSTDKQLAFVLGSTVHADATFYLNTSDGHELVSGNATFLKIDLSLVSTNIGQFNVALLQEAANLLSTLFIIPSINHYANSGIEIPTVDGLSLINASLVFGEDYVLVVADIEYK